MYLCRLTRRLIVFSGFADAKQHELTKILLDQSSIKDIRFSIRREFWRGYDFYDTLEPRVEGVVASGGRCLCAPIEE